MTTFKPSDEAFLALLRTPNRAAGVYPLMQHKLALGLKTILQISVINDRDGGYETYLLFRIEICLRFNRSH